MDFPESSHCLDYLPAPSAVEAEAIADVIKNLRRVEPDKTIAILTRLNDRLKEIDLVLQAMEIETERAEKDSLLDRKHVAALLGALQYGSKSRDKIALRSSLSMSGMSYQSINLVSEAVGNLRTTEAMDGVMFDAELLDQLPGSDLTMFRDWRKMVMDWRDICETHADTETEPKTLVPELQEGLYQTANFFVKQLRSDVAKNDAEIVIRILHNVLQGSFNRRLNALLLMVNGESKKNAKRTEESDMPRVPPVRLMSIHGSKGMEFNTVFIADCTDGVFPMKDQDLEEERRLFYVAVTRSKRRLVFSGVENSTKKPSIFLKEAGVYVSKEAPKEVE